MSESKLDSVDHEAEAASAQDYDRRAFLAACGRFAIVTPPTVTVLLSTTMTSDAIARSGGGSVKPPKPSPRPRLPPLPRLPRPKL